jgi:DNA-binding FadR family transcriptional regulator
VTTRDGTRVPRRPLRLAETVADALRERILNAEFADGALLPKQEELVEEFRVSLPSVREALRSLETEGLITVLRGNVGGSVVHLPQPAKVGYMLGMVLQSRGSTIDDLVHAMTLLQPLCAGECARRADRMRAVVPHLERTITSSEAAIEDAAEFARHSRTLHEQLVEFCGNDTFIVLVGALERLWSAQVRSQASPNLGQFAERATRDRSAAEHRQLLELIVAGDADGAEAAARAHEAEPWRHGLVGRRQRVAALPANTG